MNASDTRLYKVFLLQSITSFNCANTTQWGILHPIRTVLLYQFFQLTHYLLQSIAISFKILIFVLEMLIKTIGVLFKLDF